MSHGRIIHADTAEFLVTHKQAHDLLVVKAREPTLLDRCARLAWHNVPVADHTRDQAHGRVELRTLKAVTVNHFGFPHAAQGLDERAKLALDLVEPAQGGIAGGVAPGASQPPWTRFSSVRARPNSSRTAVASSVTVATPARSMRPSGIRWRGRRPGAPAR